MEFLALRELFLRIRGDSVPTSLNVAQSGAAHAAIVPYYFKLLHSWPATEGGESP